MSYYDYYQPEAYVPSSDTYIEKDAIVNDEIDRMRHAPRVAARTARRDHRRSVSCIYGIGSPEWYREMLIDLEVGQEFRRDACCGAWSTCNTSATTSTSIAAPSACAATSSRSSRPRGEPRVRVEFWGDEIERIVEIDP